MVYTGDSHWLCNVVKQKEVGCEGEWLHTKMSSCLAVIHRPLTSRDSLVSTECASAAVISSGWLWESRRSWLKGAVPWTSLLCLVSADLWDIKCLVCVCVCEYSSCLTFSSQNGRLGDADIERLKLTDSYINGTQVCVCVSSFTCKYNYFSCIYAVKCQWFLKI